MAPRYFGTDGLRGTFGQSPLDHETVTRLGQALAEELAEAHGPGPLVILGGDTRDSTPVLCGWLATGLQSGGARVRFAGVIPTPGIAHLVTTLRAQAGIAVSASHNPYPDNGIKLVDGLGFKWAPSREKALEERLARLGALAAELTNDAALVADESLPEAYLRSFAPLIAGQPLAGLAVALDTANGAASTYAESLFRAAGARVAVIGNEPNGRNINLACGSTHPEPLAALVRQGYDLGLALDGDADRAILIDENGQVRDGDEMLYLWANALLERHQLSPPRVVATSMSNLGLERALKAVGVEVERCGVGDREVVAMLREHGLVLGGEQSGHLVHLGHATTGDGLRTGLVLAGIIAARQSPVSRLLENFQRFPQVLINVPVALKPRFETLPTVMAGAREIENKLGQEGRLLLRYSGTEPLARVMIEGPDQELIESLAEGLASKIRQALGRAPADP